MKISAIANMTGPSILTYEQRISKRRTCYATAAYLKDDVGEDHHENDLDELDKELDDDVREHHLDRGHACDPAALEQTFLLLDDEYQRRETDRQKEDDRHHHAGRGETEKLLRFRPIDGLANDHWRIGQCRIDFVLKENIFQEQLRAVENDVLHHVGHLLA